MLARLNDVLTVEKLFLATLKHRDALAPVSGLLDQALIAAAITDLHAAGAVKFGPWDRAEPGQQDDPKVSVILADHSDHGPLQPTLDALDSYTDQQLSKLVGRSKLNPVPAVGSDLADRDAVLEHPKKIGASTFEEHGTAADEVRARLASLLSGEGTAEASDRFVLGVLEALNAAGVVLGREPGLESWSTEDFASRINDTVGHLPGVYVIRKKADSIPALFSKSRLA